MNSRLVVALPVLVALLGCRDSDPGKARAPALQTAPPTYVAKDAPAELQPYVEKATATFGRVKSGLMPRLMKAMADQGPAHAISVCKVEAPVLTRAAAEGGTEVGRTSHRLRNPANAPRDWMKPTVEAAAGKRASEVGVTVVDLGDRVGVLAPIPTMGPCVNCHGDDSQVAAETRAALAEAYPKDQARGFSEGDVRGFFWAEVPK